jgi:hypothetical protein
MLGILLLPPFAGRALKQKTLPAAQQVRSNTAGWKADCICLEKSAEWQVLLLLL